MATKKKAEGGAYALFQTDKEQEVNGIILDYPGFSIKIARAGGANKRYTKVLAKRAKPLRRSIEADLLDPDQADALLIGVFAETVVLDWTGVTDAEGKELPCTKSNIVKVLTDLPDLFADIREQANKASLFRAIEREEAAGN